MAYIEKLVKYVIHILVSLHQTWFCMYLTELLNMHHRCVRAGAECTVGH